MKFRHTECFVCNKEHGRSPLESHPVEAEYDSGGRLIGECKLGHRHVYIIQSTDHAVLFELAVMALLDGYNRESVATFATALERYYEAVVKGLLIKSGATFDCVDETWKPLAKQSERQLGAFISLFAATAHQLPALLSNSETEIRNSCVHRGVIPSRKVAHQFGLRVHQIIKLNDALLDQFKFNLNDKYIIYRLTRLGKGKEQPVTVGMPLSIERTTSFAECLEFVKEYRHKHWIA